MLDVQVGKLVKFPSGFESEVKKMTGKAQNALANRKLVKEGTVFDEVIKECIPYAQESDLNEWLIGDKYFAMVAIRIVTFGSKFDFRVKCPYCDTTSQYWFNLKDLDVKYLNGRPTENLKFRFPNCGKEVTFHLLKGKHEKMMQEILKKKSDKLITSLLMLRTDSIEGETMVDEDFFENLDADDIYAFREYVDECDCGIETTINLECPECEAEFESELPIDSNFFFPKSLKKR
jgi:hypothetical protein